MLGAVVACNCLQLFFSALDFTSFCDCVRAALVLAQAGDGGRGLQLSFVSVTCEATILRTRG
jgi:hypothetical protein